MCSLRSEGPHNFIPNTVENQKGFSLYFHKIAQTTNIALRYLQAKETED